MDEEYLVGRERETAQLRRRMGTAIAGRGSLVLLEGDAGAGKTALARWAAGHAGRAGMRVAWGACLEGEGAPPYRPWTQILRDLGHGSALPDKDAASRYQMFDEVVELLRAAAAPDALLLVLDDLHWADLPSLRLLQALAASVVDSRLLVLAAYRGREPFAHPEAPTVLRAIGRERAATQLTLGPLAPAEVAELVAHALGYPPEKNLIETMQRRSEGNPLFVLELLRLVDASGVRQAGLPGGIREVITLRLDELPPATRRFLRHASVLGREFTAALLSAMIDEPVPEVVELLDPALTAEVLQVASGQSLRFGHVLTQEVLYAELPTAQRQRWHARAAAAMANGSLDVLAYHLRQAAPLGGADEAVSATVEAAERARNQLAYEHAALLYQEAFHLVPESDAHRAQLLLESARCQFRAGAVEDAWRSCRDAASLGFADADATVVADAAIVLRGITNSPLTAEIHELCRQALTMLAGADPVRQARVLAQLAVTADPFAAATEPELSVRAMRAAEATGDTDARFLAMQAHHAALVSPANVLERLSLGERAIRLGVPEYTAWGHVWRMDAFWQLSRRVQLDAELAAFTNLVRQLREPLWLWRLAMVQANLAALEGRFDQARVRAGEALSIGRRGGLDMADFFHLVFSSHVGLQTGTGLEDVERGVRQFVETGPYLARIWHAEVLQGLGRKEEAAALWSTVAPHLSGFPRDSPEWIVATAGSAQLAVQFKDASVAATLYTDLLPYADQQVSGGGHTPCYGPVSLYLGMLAALLGDKDAAAGHLRAALVSAKAMGAPPDEVAAHLELARVAVAGAAGHLQAATHLAQRLGMLPLLSMAAGLRPNRATALSAREEQVAALVAEGLTNRQIAQRLHLSERTAENHVTHILTKLGFESRARIAAWWVEYRQ